MTEVRTCHRCETRPAVVCDECRRALGLLDHGTGFGSIARHPDQGTDCRLCTRGLSVWCVECLCESVLAMRNEPAGPYSAPTMEQFAIEAERWADWRNQGL